MPTPSIVRPMVWLFDGVDQRVKGYGSNPLGGFMGYMFAEQVWLNA